MKITSGALNVRDEISYLSADGMRITEKVSQIRLYSGDKFEQVDTVCAGEICAVIGLSSTYVMVSTKASLVYVKGAFFMFIYALSFS